MELKERRMELDLTEEDFLTMEKTKKWTKSDLFSLLPYIVMFLLQIVLAVREANIMYLCFALFTIASLDGQVHHIFWSKEKQALFNVVCEKLHKFIKEEEK